MNESPSAAATVASMASESSAESILGESSPAAHPLVGNTGDLLTIADDSSSVIGRGSVIVEGAACRDIDCAAVYDDIPIGIDAVRIPGAHHDGDFAPVDFNFRGIAS